MLYKDNKKIVGINVGNSGIGKIYKGEDLIWQKPGDLRLVFAKNKSNPENITRYGYNCVVNDILPKMGRYACKFQSDGSMLMCKLNTGNSNYYVDSTLSILTGNDGDIMVYKPAFNYKFIGSDTSSFTYDISSKTDPLNGWIYSPESLIGTYISSMRNNRLYSNSGRQPITNLSQNDLSIAAKARGEGYDLMTFEQHCMVALLFYAKYANRDSQIILGNGNVTYTDQNGTTNSIGDLDTNRVTTGHASFSGIEGIHGAVLQYITGITSSGNVCTITNSDGTTRFGNTVNAGGSGWITELAISVGPYFDMFPTNIGGSYSTYYTDYYQHSSTNNIVFARSFTGNSELGGISTLLANYSKSVTSSRLSFHGKLVFNNDAGRFINIPVIN